MTSNKLSMVASRVGSTFQGSVMTEECLRGVAKERHDMWFDEDAKSLMLEMTMTSNWEMDSDISMMSIPASKDAAYPTGESE